MADSISILLVDDDPVMRGLIKQILSQNHEVDTAEDGKQAWQQLTAAPEKYNLLITDIQMPEMTGTTLLEKVKKSFPALGVIMISGSTDIDTAVECIRKGAFDFVTKPLNNPSEIDFIIDRWAYQQSLEAKLVDYARLHEEMMHNVAVYSFLSIDVAGSRLLKKRGDPFLVQYSFKKYQDSMATIIQDNGGSVFSTSGDGIMACFKAAANAADAGLGIIEFLPEFNQKISRLSGGFNLRIGAHTGPVIVDKESSISEMFSETLDISGHVQKAAPENELVVSKTFKDHLGQNWQTEPIEMAIDDYPLFKVISPAA